MSESSAVRFRFHSVLVTFDQQGLPRAVGPVRIEQTGPGQYHLTLEAQDGPLTVERDGDRPRGVCA
jgi:hypothetical protein